MYKEYNIDLLKPEDQRRFTAQDVVNAMIDTTKLVQKVLVEKERHEGTAGVAMDPAIQLILDKLEEQKTAIGALDAKVGDLKKDMEDGMRDLQRQVVTMENKLNVVDARLARAENRWRGNGEGLPFLEVRFDNGMMPTAAGLTQICNFQDIANLSAPEVYQYLTGYGADVPNILLVAHQALAVALGCMTLY